MIRWPFRRKEPQSGPATAPVVAGAVDAGPPSEPSREARERVDALVSRAQ